MALGLGTAVAFLTLDATGFARGIDAAAAKTATLTKGFANTQNRAIKTGTAIAGVGRLLTTGITAPIVAFGAASVKAGTEFDSSMSTVKSVSLNAKNDLEQVAQAAERLGVKYEKGATDGETAMNALRETAIKMGNDTKFTANESAQALYYMGQAGWNAQQMINGIPGVLNLAAAGGTELARTSDIVTDAISGFGHSAEETVKIVRGGFNVEIPIATRLADIMASTMSNSNTNVDKLGSTFSYVAPIAGTFGYSMEDVAIAAGLMANAGIKATRAGTTMRQGFKRLVAPTDDAAAAMKKYGFSAFDAEGKTKPLRQQLIELRGIFGNLDVEVKKSDGTMKTSAEIMEEYGRKLPVNDQEKLSDAVKVFGTTALPGMLAMMVQSDKAFKDLADQIDNSSAAFVMHNGEIISYNDALKRFGKTAIETGEDFEVLGYAQGMAAIQMDNLSGDVTLLKSALGTTKIIVSDLVKNHLRRFVKMLTELVRKFNELDKPAQKHILKLVAMAAAFGPLLLTVGKAIAGFGRLAQGLQAAGGILKAVTASSFLPAIGIIAGIAAVGYTIYKNWDTLGPKFEEVGSKLKTALMPVLKSLGDLLKNIITIIVGLVEKAMPVIMKLVDVVTSFVQKAAPILEKVIDAVSEALVTLMTILEPIIDFLLDLVDIVADLLEPAFDLLLSVIEAVADIFTFFLDLLGLMPDKGKDVEDSAKNISKALKGVSDFIKKYISPAVKSLLGLFEGFTGFIGNEFKAGIDMLNGDFDSAKTHAEDGFISIGKSTAGFLNTVTEAVTGESYTLEEWALGFEQFFSDVGDFFVNIGTGIGDFFWNFWDNLCTICSDMGDFFVGIWDSICEDFEAIGQLFKDLWDGICFIASSIGDFFVAIFEGIGDFFTTIWNGICDFFEGVADVFGDIWDGICSAADAVGSTFVSIFEGIGDFFEGLWNSICDFFEGVADVFSDIWDGICNAIDNAATLIDDAMTGISDFFEGCWDSICGFFESAADTIGDIWDGICDGIDSAFTAIGDAFDPILDWFGNLGSSILDAVGDAGSWLLNVGKDIISGLWKGISDAASWLWEKLTGFFGGMVDGIKDLLGIHSPSAVMRDQVGIPVIQGIEVGMSKEVPSLLKLADKTAGNLANGFINGYKKKEKEIEKTIKSLSDKLDKARKQGNKKQVNYYKRQIKTQKENLKRLKQNRIRSAEDTLDYYKKYHDTSIQYEINYWTKILAKQKKGTQQYKDAAEKLKEVKYDMQKQMQEIDKEYTKGVAKVAADLKKSIEEVEKAYQEAIDNRAEQLASSLSLFDEFTSTTENSAASLISNLQSQVNGLEQWDAQLDALAAKNVPKKLVDQIAAMGPSALADLKLLNSMTEEQLSQYVSLWERKNAIAYDRATSEVDRQEYTDKIQALIDESNEKLAELADTYNTGMEELGSKLRVMTTKLTQDVVKGVKVVIDESAPSIKKSVVQLSDSLKDLDISKGTKVVNSFTTTTSKTIKKWGNTMVNTVVTTGQRMNTNTTLYMNSIKKGISKTLDEVLRGLNSWVVKVGNAAISAGSRFISNWKRETASAYSNGYYVGQQIVNGVIDGINSRTYALLDAIEEMVTLADEQAKMAADVNSPSKLFMDGVGVAIPEGVAAGVNKGTPLLLKEIDGMVNKSVNKAEEDLNSSLDDVKTTTIDVSEMFKVTDIADRIKEAFKDVTLWFRDVTNNMSTMTDTMLDDIQQIVDKSGEMLYNIDDGKQTFENVLVGTSSTKTVDRNTSANAKPQTESGTTNQTFNFYSPTAIDEVEASRLLKQTSRNLAEGFA